MEGYMSILTINRDYRGKKLPLYKKYPRQIHPQRAYLVLTEDGNLDANYTGEVGNAVPSDVWHHRTLRFQVPSTISADGLDKLIEDFLPIIQKIYNGHTVESNGNDLVGKLTIEASIALEDLEYALDVGGYSYEQDEEEEEEENNQKIEEKLYNKEGTEL